MTPDNNLTVLTAARDAWLAAASFREQRERHKRYTYGDQWGDLLPDPDGRLCREGDLVAASGRRPLTNNMIRHIVKTVIGRYRVTSRDDESYAPADDVRRSIVDDNSLLELDCRMLEEFLISGCAVQRVARESRRGCSRLWIDNVDPRRFFVNAYRDPRGNDIELIGMLHDLSFPDIIARFAGSSRSRAAELARIYGSGEIVADCAGVLGDSTTDSTDFFTAPAGRCRAIEVWTLDCRNKLLCHDRRAARAFRVDNRKDGRSAVSRLNGLRLRSGDQKLATRRTLEFVWHCRWFAPDGSLLASFDSPYPHASHPFVVKLYPLTDGEVHSFVEDVIDQQKCINRMILMIDHVIGSSAKGVLLFPQDQKPAGVDWRDIASTWARSNGVIPITGNSQHLPQQVMTSTADCGAYQLLDLEMKLFNNISGISDAIAGRNVSPSTGSALYESQLRNSIIALTDLIDSFAAFRRDRDRKASQA